MTAPGEAAIRASIARHGSLPFRSYMELALYDPSFGYYRRPFPTLRDFQTAPQTSAAFPRLLARFVAMANEVLPGPEPLVVVELGAGDGRLAAEAMATPALAELAAHGGLTWIAVDLSYTSGPPAHRGAFQPLAAGDLACLRHLPRAVIVANEFFDALPVALLECRGGRFREVHVTERDGRLVETLLPIADRALAGSLAHLRPARVEGGRIEICLAARDVVRQLAERVESGFLLVLDYGGNDAQAAAAAPRGGTVRAYHRHRLLPSPLDAPPGEADITADVNFDALARWARAAGWHTVYDDLQRRFLLTLGLLEEVTALAAKQGSVPDLARYLAAKRLLVPDPALDRFRALILARGKGCTNKLLPLKQ